MDALNKRLLVQSKDWHPPSAALQDLEHYLREALEKADTWAASTRSKNSKSFSAYMMAVITEER